ncbi:Methionine aminopeptidase 1D, mitochondrial [Apodemus speciosus]|uniref:Methionine aminopeptidase 1D, mitochondrial n=1 Tax=Apodemus speciosus TaxID=105296 RepID=A0ABQ0EH65_APOSI
MAAPIGVQLLVRGEEEGGKDVVKGLAEGRQHRARVKPGNPDPTAPSVSHTAAAAMSGTSSETPCFIEVAALWLAVLFPGAVVREFCLRHSIISTYTSGQAVNKEDISFSGDKGISPTVWFPRLQSLPHILSPRHIKKPDYVTTGIVPDWGDSIEVKNEDQIQGLKVDMTTEEIDALVHREIIRHDAYPSPLGYGRFPKSVCTSVNNVLCHGIPDSRPLQDGDIINIDVTVYYNGYHGDTSETFLVGNVDESGKKLVEVARRCRDEAIAACRAGAPFSVIGNTIRSNDNDLPMEEGMAFTIGVCAVRAHSPHQA